MPSEFDQYASNYATVLDRALSATGEASEYFAHGRVACFAACLRRFGLTPGKVLDFGCGTGSTSALLLQALGCESVVGVDPSAECIAHARRGNSSGRMTFLESGEYHPHHDLGAAYCNGVFHHVPPSERRPVLRVIHDSLAPSGLFGFWENNPWNPGTKYVMSRCAFDENAITISPRQARILLSSAGFEVLQLDFLFFFPGALRRLRPIEPLFRKIPLGGQYQVLCRKPA